MKVGFLLAPLSRAEKRVGERGRMGSALPRPNQTHKVLFLLGIFILDRLHTYSFLVIFRTIYLLYEKAEECPVRREKKFVFKLKQIPDCVKTAYLLEVGLI